jgi:hypothetical protein
VNHNQGKLTVKKVLIWLILGAYCDLVHHSSLRVYLHGERVFFKSSPPTLSKGKGAKTEKKITIMLFGLLKRFALYFLEPFKKIKVI